MTLPVYVLLRYVSYTRLGRLLGYSEHEVSCLLVELWLQQATPTNSLPL